MKEPRCTVTPVADDVDKWLATAPPGLVVTAAEYAVIDAKLARDEREHRESCRRWTRVAVRVGILPPAARLTGRRPARCPRRPAGRPRGRSRARRVARSSARSGDSGEDPGEPEPRRLTGGAA